MTDPALPPRVTRAAAEHGLGPPVAASGIARPLGLAGALAGGAVACWVAAGVGVAVDLPAVAAGGLVLGVLALGWAVGIMRTGFMGTWLFAGGVVHRESWRVTAAAWPEVRELQLFRLGGRRAMTTCTVVPVRGRRMTVAAGRAAAPEPFAARLRAAAEAAGVPVVERSPFPATGRRAA